MPRHGHNTEWREAMAANAARLADRAENPDRRSALEHDALARHHQSLADMHRRWAEKAREKADD